MDPQIVVSSLTPEHEGQTWSAEKLLRIGRLPQQEIVLNHSSVSRRHAELYFDSQGWVVRDVGSSNGTFLNGVRVGRIERKVRPGDLLQCGDLLLKIKHLTEQTSSDIEVDDKHMQIVSAAKHSWQDLLPMVNGTRSTDRVNHRPLLSLLQIGRDFHATTSLNTYLESVLGQAAEIFNARYATILMHDQITGHLCSAATLAGGRGLHPGMWLRSSAVQFTLEYGESHLCHSTLEIDEVAADAVKHTLGSLIFALLRTPRRQIGVLCLARTVDQPRFTADDLSWLDALALCVSPNIESVERMLHGNRQLLIQTLTRLAEMVERRDASLVNHSQRVTDYALQIAAQLKLSQQQRQHLRIGVPLHDLGKIGLGDQLLHKTGALSAAEAEWMKSSAIQGASLLEALPGSEPLLPIVRSHQERWDGSGYPDGLAGEQIPILARVVAVAETLDLLTISHADERALSLVEALAVIRSRAGTEFDPACVTALERSRREIEELFLDRKFVPKTLTASQLQQTCEGVFFEGLSEDIADSANTIMAHQGDTLLVDGPK